MTNLDFHTILYYYAIFCLIFSPVSISLFVVLYRKTKVLTWVDRMIDKILGEAPKAPADKEDEKKADIQADRPELSGIACFNLHVGDGYYCRSSMQYSEDNLHELCWTTDNDFLGEFGEDGLFTAKRMGVIGIFATRKEDDFDKGRQAYIINILPSDQGWFGDRLIGAVTRRMKREDVLASNIKRKTKYEKTAKNIICFADKDRIPETILQFDKEGFLERGIYIIKSGGETWHNLVNEAMPERFERVELDDDSVQIWIHKIINDEGDEIDVYAYIRQLRNGNIAFCVSNTWREYGATEEFLLNVKMAARVFEECLPGEPVPDIIAIKAPKRHVKTVEVSQFAETAEEENGPVSDAEKGKPEEGSPEEPGAEEVGQVETVMAGEQEQAEEAVEEEKETGEDETAEKSPEGEEGSEDGGNEYADFDESKVNLAEEPDFD